MVIKKIRTDILIFKNWIRQNFVKWNNTKDTMNVSNAVDLYFEKDADYNFKPVVKVHTETEEVMGEIKEYLDDKNINYVSVGGYGIVLPDTIELYILNGMRKNLL